MAAKNDEGKEKQFSRDFHVGTKSVRVSRVNSSYEGRGKEGKSFLFCLITFCFFPDLSAFTISELQSSGHMITRILHALDMPNRIQKYISMKTLVKTLTRTTF